GTGTGTGTGSPGSIAGGMPGQQAPQTPALPPTGLQQQLESLNSLYNTMNSQEGVAFDPRVEAFNAAQNRPGGVELQGQGGAQAIGSTSLDQLARNLAQRYGLTVGRGRLVDEQGNFLQTPDQLAAASGGAVTSGQAAVMLQHIGEGMTRQQNEMAQNKSIAALETGLGQVQS